MESLTKVYRLFCLALLANIFILSSCTSEDACESNNTGTFIFQNTSSTATLQVFINEFGTISANGLGDVNVPPGESESIDLPAGQQNLKARYMTSSCSNGRCQISTSGLPERDVDLNSCEQSTITY